MLAQHDADFLTSLLPFWKNLSKSEQESLIAHTKSMCYKQGENIHNAQKECVGVLLIQEGELRTYILSHTGKEVTLFRTVKNEVCILSASCLLKDITFDVHIDAEKDTRVLLINAPYFSTLIEKNLYVENFSLKETTNRFSDVMWAMEQILFMSLDKRVAIFLLDEAAKNGSNKIELTHEHIAKYIGSAREAVTRMLKYFANEKLVTLHRGSINIIDKPRLQKLL